MIGTVHIPGPFKAGVQVCTQCGETLTDYRNCMVAEGGAPLRGWAEGIPIVRCGRVTTTAGPPPFDGVPCLTN